MYSVSLRLFIMAFACTLLPMAALFGGNFQLAQGILPIMCAIMLMLSLTVSVQIPQDIRSRLLLAGVGIPVVLVLLMAACQVIPLNLIFSSASGLVNPFWSLVAGQGGWNTVSLAPGDTIANLGYALGYAAAALALYRVGQTYPRPLVIVVALTVTLASAYGIVIFASGNHSVLWLPKTSYMDSLSATFINRNSFATFAGLGVLASLALGLQRVGEISQRLDGRQRLRAFWLLVIRPGWPWMCAAVICFVALVLTNSRAGLTASLCGMLVMLGSLAGMRPPARWPLVAMILAVVIFALVVLGAIGGALGSRLGTVTSDAQVRQLIYKDTGSLISHYPWTGAGFGTYLHAFSTVRTPEVLQRSSYIVDHAHNTYLELTSELGYPGAILLGLSCICMGILCMYGLATRRRAIIWPALGISTIVLVGGHALADFSLSIPAVTLVTLALLMPAIAQSMPLKEPETPITSNRAAVAVLSLLMLGLVAFSGWQTAASYHALKAQSTVRNILESKHVSPSDVFLAQRNLMECLAINPYHPACSENLAQIKLSLATGYGLTGDNAAVGLVYLNMARQQYQNALANSPANPLSWYRLARISAYQGQIPESVTYLANSLLTGPAEPYVAIQRIPLMLSLISQADAENATLFKANIQELWRLLPWSVAAQISANPSVQLEFVTVIGNTPDLQANWPRMMHTPYPLAQGLGEAPQKR